MIVVYLASGSKVTVTSVSGVYPLCVLSSDRRLLKHGTTHTYTVNTGINRNITNSILYTIICVCVWGREGCKCVCIT